MTSVDYKAPEQVANCPEWRKHRDLISACLRCGYLPPFSRANYDVPEDADAAELKRYKEGDGQGKHGDTSVLQDDPFPPSSQRARIAGLFQQLALWLEQASGKYEQGIRDDALAAAAKVCVELSHAVLEKP